MARYPLLRRIGAALAGPSIPPTPVDSSMPVLMVVEAGHGRVELTETDRRRTISYADIFATQPALAAVVGRMMRRMASVPRKVYRMPVRGQSQNGRAKFPEEDQDNSLHDLLCNPAPGIGHMQLREWQTLSVLVHGSSLLAKYRGVGAAEAPTGMLPLDWRYLSAWASQGQPIVLWSTLQTGEVRSVLPLDVVYTSWTTVAGAAGAYIGTSPLQQLGTTVMIDEAAQAYAAAHFRNGARPSAIVTVPPGVNARNAPGIVDRLQAKAEELHGGIDNAFRIAVMGGGATIAPWGQTADEAQLVETRQVDRLEFCAVYDQHYAALFATEATLTPEVNALGWKDLAPWLAMMDDRLNAQLVYPEPEWSDAGLFVASDLNEVIYGDPIVLSDKMVAEYLAGLRKLDEARAPLGLDPVPDGSGDRFFSPAPPTAPGDTGNADTAAEQAAVADAQAIRGITRV